MPKVTVEEFLENKLGIQITVISNKGWCRSCCPIHGEARPSFGVLRTYPYVARCFACNYKDSLVGLTSKILKISRDKAFDLVNEHIDVKLAVQEEREKKISVVSDAVAEMYVNNFPGSMAEKYAQYRKIPKWASLLWQFGYDDLNHSLVIPMRNTATGMIQTYFSVEFNGGFNDVTKLKGEDAGKTVTLPHNYTEFKDCVVVEGYVDAVKAAQALWARNIWAMPVAVNMAFPTKEQLSYVRKFKRVYIGLDHDDAGMRGRDYCIKNLKDKAFLYDFVYPRDLKDPGELRGRHEVSTKLIV